MVSQLTTPEAPSPRLASSARRVLVTGAAGFIGYHVCEKLLSQNLEVLGIDNLNNYYNPILKRARLDRITGKTGFSFQKADIADREAMQDLFARSKPSHVIHLAAQPGVRYSLQNPHAYIEANIVGFTNILEGCRHHGVRHLVYASSSSVYGANTRMPFSVHDNVDHPVSLYAATKKANELMAHTYSHLYGIPTTGLRFFTVYGPWGRPDMAIFQFTRAILAGEPISVFNNGDMRRDFTYIDDIVEGVVRIAGRPAAPDPRWDGAHPDPASSRAPYRLYNIGNNNPVKLGELIETLESCIGKKAQKRFLPMQPGDIQASCADISDLEQEFGFAPTTPIKAGIERFLRWYRAEEHLFNQARELHVRSQP